MMNTEKPYVFTTGRIHENWENIIWSLFYSSIPLFRLKKKKSEKGCGVTDSYPQPIIQNQLNRVGLRFHFPKDFTL